MGLLTRGMSFLAERQAASESEVVSVSRPGVFVGKSVAAVIGGPGFGQESMQDVPGRIGDWQVDFIIRVEDWAAAGCQGVPLHGDRFVRPITIAGVSKNLVFVAYADNVIPAFDWGEPERITYQIHTRLESESRA